MHDILIRGGTLYDGSGSAGGTCALAHVCRRLCPLGPGFIDIKTHSDFTLPINPKAESKVRQGVTTEIIGHCGFSVAPCLPGQVQLLKDYLSPSAPWLPFRERTF